MKTFLFILFSLTIIAYVIISDWLRGKKQKYKL